MSGLFDSITVCQLVPENRDSMYHNSRLQKWIRATAMAVALIGGFWTAPAAIGQTEKSNDMAGEIFESWQKYVDSLAPYTIRAAATIVTGSPNEERRQTINSDDYFAYRDGDHQIAQVFLNIDEPNSKWLVATNADYCFELHPAGPSSFERTKWILFEWEPISDEPGGLRHVVTNRLAGIQRALVPSLGRYSLTELVNDDRFQINIARLKDEKGESGDGSSIAYTFEILEKRPYPAVVDGADFSLMVHRGSVWLDPARGHLPVQYDFQISLRDKLEGESIWDGYSRGKIEWAQNVDGIWYPKVRHFIEEADGRAGYYYHESEMEIQEFNTGVRLTPADFRLPAFGLPEPPEFARRAWWPYAVLALAGLVLIAIALKWNQQRRANG